MKKFGLLSVFGIFVLIGCHGKEIKNQWAPQNLSIDGKSEEWENVPLTYAEKTNMAMGLTNDSENLFVMFRLNDMEMARRIQMMGVTVWLNKDEKKEKDYGINYRGSAEMQREMRSREMPNDRDDVMGQERMRPKMERFSADLPDFGKIRIIENKEERDIPENNLIGPAAASGLSSGYYCYEFRMPIPINVELGKKIKVGLELGGLSNENKEKMRGDMESGGRSGGGRSGGGMGGGRGGMRGGGRPGGMLQPGSGLEKQELWFDVVLATRNQK